MNINIILVFLALTLPTSIAWITPLNEFPEDFQTEVHELDIELKNLADKESKKEYYTKLMTSLEDIYNTIETLSSQKPVIGSETNFLHRKNGEQIYELLASKCIHRLNLVKKSIESNENNDPLNKIIQDLNKIVNEIENKTPIFMERTKQIKEFIQNLVTNDVLISAIRSAYNVDRNTMVIRANVVKNKMRRLIESEKRK